MKDTVEFKIDIKLFTDKMKKELHKYEAHIGILSAEQHEEDDFTTAELGAVHEFGSLSGNIPARPFFALTEQMKGEEMAEFITKNEEKIIEAAFHGKMQGIMKKIAAKWNAYIHECFETEGWGTWKKLEPETLAARERKRFEKGQGGAKILQDTGALERSITYEVK